MTEKLYEWHSACALHRRLRGLVPRSTLFNWITTRKLKTYGRRGTMFAFCPDDLYRIELTETAKRIVLLDPCSASTASAASDHGTKVAAQSESRRDSAKIGATEPPAVVLTSPESRLKPN